MSAIFLALVSLLAYEKVLGVMKDKKFLRVVESAMKGDEESFSKLMQMRSRNILYIALSIIHDKELSQDVAQEAALLMQRDIVKLKSAPAFDSWMYRVVYNACMNEKKKMKRTQENIKKDIDSKDDTPESREEFLPESFVSSEEKRKEILAAINELPEKYRICILLYYYEDMKYHEIAEVLDTDVNDVSYRLRNAKKLLRQKFEDSASVENETVVRKAPAALASVPVITQVLHLDEQGAIIGAMVDRFVAAVATGAAATTAGVGATTTATATVAAPLVAKLMSGTAVTVTTVVTSFLAAAAIAIGAYSYSTVGSPEVFTWQDPVVVNERTIDYGGNPHIEFTSSNGDSPYGVTEILFVDNQSALVSITWAITAADTGTELLNGEGFSITFSTGLETLAPGEYRIDFYALDDHGASAHSYRNFTIENISETEQSNVEVGMQ